MMERICLLRAEYNQCPFIRDDQRCGSSTACGMLAKLDDRKKGSNKYVRKSRWYEKYYK